MTLILHCLTPEFILNISDRRLTWPDGKLYDDTANKAIMLHNNSILTYTGLAFIDQLRTDEWIARQLVGARDTPSAVSKLVSALDNRVCKQNVSNKELTISMSYFGTYGSDATNKARVLILTNNLNSKTLRPEETARQKFNGFARHLPRGFIYHIVELGQATPRKIVKKLERNILAGHEHRKSTSKCLSPDSLVKCIQATFQDVARVNRAVGDNLMVSLLVNWEIPEMAKLGNAFGYLAGRDRSPVLYAPIIVDQNMMVGRWRLSPDPIPFKF